MDDDHDEKPFQHYDKIANLHVEYRPSPDAAASAAPGDPAFHGEATVDIVAVHGLASKYPRTWSVERPDGSRYYWLADKLPKDMPTARILGFEYASEWYGDPSHTNLRQCAIQLLMCLIRDRCHVGKGKMCPARRQRPIIFIGHSFGGLVIKEALVLAAGVLQTNASPKKYEAHRDLLGAIAGVIFLGTPHRGSPFSLLAEVKMSIGRIIGTSSYDELVRILRADSPTISALQDDFNTLYTDTRVSDLKLVCYVETKELRVPPYIVVPRDSACLDYSANRDMDANHMEMAKFHEGYDQNYDHLLADLRMIYNASQLSIPKRFAAWRYGSSAPDFARERLVQWLAPSREPQKSTYLSKLKAHRSAPYTCQWIQSVPQFQDWSSSSSTSSSLWVTGKAGSGKSVLAAYLINELSVQGTNASREQGDVIKSTCLHSPADPNCGFKRAKDTTLFFFCGIDRANETPEKILGTLIHQLLAAHSENDKLVSMAYELREQDMDGTSASSLCQLLQSMCSVVGPTTIVLDGLEENSSFPMCANALSHLRDDRNIKLIFLSQDTDNVSTALADAFGIGSSITMTDFTKDDIDKFAAEMGARLSQKNVISKDIEPGIVRLLRDKAHGMFRWVSSASEYLEQEVEGPEDIERCLDELPSDLISTYEKTFERMAMKENNRRDQRIRIVLQFLAVSGTIITPRDLKFAFLIAETKGECIQANLDPEASRSTDDAVATDIKKLLGPMVEFPSSDGVRLAHPSIRTAITRVDAGSAQSKTARYKFSLEEAHYQICKICMRLCSESTLVYANAFSETRIALVEYAWTYWPYHFHQSRRMFSDQEPEFSRLFEQMLSKISGSALAYLDAFMVFLCRPLKPVPGHFSDREYMLSLQRAQDSLLQPTRDLCALRRSPVLANQIRDLHNAFKPIYTQSQLAARGDEVWNRFIPVESLRSLKNNLVGSSTAVQRLRLDDAIRKMPLAVQPSSSLRTLLEIARHLRIVALRFAVDPIYSALIMTAAGETYSPLHPLLYLAQFYEDCGSIPYWDLLPPSLDMLGNFVCDEKDSEFAPAKFVLSCFEWRLPRDEKYTDSGAVARYVPSSHVLARGPRPSNHQLTRVSTANAEQVRRLHHEMPVKQHFVAHTMYATFKSPNDLVRDLITNPLSFFHMRQSLMIEADLPHYQDPNVVLTAAAPLTQRETLFEEYLHAVPHIVEAYFVQYLVYILEVAAQLSKTAMAVHWARFETAVGELVVALGFFSRYRNDPVNKLPRLRLWYLAPAVILFCIRSRYFPSFGAYYMPHDWQQFAWCWRHPAAYLDMQNTLSIWSWVMTVLRIMLYSFLGSAMIGVGLAPNIDKTPVGHAANIYGIFHHICTIQRSLFSILMVLATVTASALVMMNDPGSMKSLWKWSIFYWFNIFFVLLSQAAQTGAIQNGAGLVGVLTLTFVQLFLIYLMCCYAEAIIWFISCLLYPLTGPVVFLWRTMLSHYMVMMKVCGVFVLLLACAKAFHITHKFLWDPYNIEGSLGKLVKASEMASSCLQPGQVLRVGYYPLGAADNTPVKQLPPRSALERDFAMRTQRELGAIVVRTGQNLMSRVSRSEGGLPLPAAQSSHNTGTGLGGGLPLPAAQSSSNTRETIIEEEISPEELFRQFFGGGTSGPLKGPQSSHVHGGVIAGSISTHTEPGTGKAVKQA